MNATQTDDTNNASQGTQTDQYDHILRAMENGLLISINNDAKGSTPTGELKVVYSKDDSRPTQKRRRTLPNPPKCVRRSRLFRTH
jgi:hypothetical protein